MHWVDIRRAATALALSAGTALLAIGLTAAPAHAETCDGPVTREGLCLGGTTPGSPPSEGPGTEPGGGNEEICKDIYTGAVVPCTAPTAGHWIESQQCYGFMLNPQPPAGSSLWDGHDPSEGSVWGCDTDFANDDNAFFLPGAPPVVDGGTVALDLIERAPFPVPTLHLAPGPTGHSYVNVENWLWVDQAQWRDVSVSVNAGAGTVTLTAKPSRTHWSMGTAAQDERGCRGQSGPVLGRRSVDLARPDDCSTGVNCTVGRAWTTGMTASSTTGCSYTYRRPSVTFDAARKPVPDKSTWTITGRFHYDVSWTCTGRCSAASGTLGEYPGPPARSCLTVYERQTVVVDPKRSPGPAAPVSMCA